MGIVNDGRMKMPYHPSSGYGLSQDEREVEPPALSAISSHHPGPIAGQLGGKLDLLRFRNASKGKVDLDHSGRARSKK